MKKILIIVALLFLTGCGTTYKTTYETATVGGVTLDRVPNSATIRIGKQHTTITENGLKRTVENAKVKVEDGAIVVRYNDRITTKYE